ncbi:hypothetical protein AAW14_04145 [Streptomyces hygroscopicus]|uniref:hypothetical protein n=1 Tax=Streptomyces hygroscopicus TaxID=1912 RepID=UPI00223EBEDB|nr:hypothetical protein [Streptomyces hygroscopicus]MCW7941269.1 hypothetical protein [Streptomyces hygroscopicus]
MSESTTATTDLTSQYTAQVTVDLEQNVKEQERISAEIAALQEQLTNLQRDHTVLVNMQRALGVAPAPAESAATTTAATVPAPRGKTSAETGPSRRTRAKKDTPAPKTAEKPSARRANAKKAAGKASATKTAQPTLVELVRSHLGQQSEPRSAAEIATALGEAHPERSVKVTVVRTTLEGLVARNQAQRSKQGASVFYTASDTSSDTPSDTSSDASEPTTAPEAEAQPDQAG